MKHIIAYAWILSLFGALFLGGEVAMVSHKMDRENYSMKLKNCQQVITKGELYGK